MRPRENHTRVVPKLDVCIGGAYLPRGEAIPLIVELENAHELRRSGVLSELPLRKDPSHRRVA